MHEAAVLRNYKLTIANSDFVSKKIGSLLLNKNTKIIPYKITQHIQMKECVSECVVSKSKFSSVTLNQLAVKALKVIQ